MPETSTVRETAKEFLLLAQTLNEAEAVQWQASPVPKPREDVVRNAGGHGDPTGDAALDPRRLALREAIEDTRADVEELAGRLRAHRENVYAVLARYLGDA